MENNLWCNPLLKLTLMLNLSTSKNVLGVTSLAINLMNANKGEISNWLRKKENMQKDVKMLMLKILILLNLTFRIEIMGSKLCAFCKNYCSHLNNLYTQWNAIFKTICIINKKVHNIIIGSESSENVFSKALGLSTKPHLKPYKIGSIKKYWHKGDINMQGPIFDWKIIVKIWLHLM